MKKTSLRAMSESNLARFQSQQGGNDCAIHALVAAIELLTSIRLDPQDIIAEVNRIWWRGQIYRLLPKSGITPPMQVRLLGHLAEKHQLPLSARLLHLTPDVLRALADDEHMVSLVTIYWWFRRAPAIYYMDQPQNFNSLSSAGGHTMVFAAYDPDHRSGPMSTPWGFINSWVSQGSGLFWMEDKAFRSSWGISIPRWGNNATVLITLKEPISS